MRMVSLPPRESETYIEWQGVKTVRYVNDRRKRYLVLDYGNGALRYVEIHQARELYYKVQPRKNCPAPCFRRWETDTASNDCPHCKLAEGLAGLDCEVRPDPIPPRLPKPFDWRNCAIAGLVALVVLLIGILGQEHHSPAPPPTPKREHTQPARAIPVR